jgi:hypothetical protein
MAVTADEIGALLVGDEQEEVRQGYSWDGLGTPVMAAKAAWTAAWATAAACYHRP